MFCGKTSNTPAMDCGEIATSKLGSTISGSNQKFVPRKDLPYIVLGKSENNRAEPYDDQRNGFSKKLVNRIHKTEISSGKSNSEDIHELKADYPESIEFPPVFETHIMATNLNGFIPYFDAHQHAFMGLRFTILDPYGRYKRVFFRVGFGNDGDNPRTTLFRILTNLAVPAKIMDDTEHKAVISTQTKIDNEKIPVLINNIIRYFDTYRNYHFYTRNCNTFVYEMAKSIGLGVASKHKTVSPVGAAKNIFKSMLAKKESPEKYFAEFDNTKSYWGEESNGGKRKPLKENNGKFSLPLTANEFSEEAKKAAKKDHRIRHRKEDFVIESMKAEFSNVEDKISVLPNCKNTDDVTRHCKYAEQKTKQRAFSLEKGWTNLELYFMQISNLFYQIRMMLNNDDR